MADFYTEILTAPCYIEKATVRSITDPAIYLSEGITFNQVKKEEILIKDVTNTAWVVGYIDTTATGTATYTPPSAGTYPTVDLSAFWDARGSEIYSKPFNLLTKCNIGRREFIGRPSLLVEAWDNGTVNVPKARFNKPYRYRLKSDTDHDDRLLKDAYSGLGSTYWNQFSPIIAAKNSKQFSEQQIQLLQQYNGQVIKYNNNLYTLKITELGTIWNIEYLPQSQAQYVYNPAVDSGLVELDPYDDQDKCAELGWNWNAYQFELIPYTAESVTVSISGNRRVLKNAAYCMFAIPYTATKIYNGGVFQFNTASDIAAPIATAIATKLGSACYDLQLLPYCPIPEFIDDRGGIEMVSMEEGKDYDAITQDDVTVSYIFWCRSDSFTQRASLIIPLDYLPETIEDYKVANETKMARLCAPNYSSVFEFKPTEAIESRYTWVILSYTYRPYNPYIQVQPLFSKLYGANFGDARGLVCGGDYSLPQITDQWQLYQVNNKYANETFDRQIENMEIQQDIQKKQQIWSSVSGALGGAGIGAGAGMAVGRPIGAGVGAAVGGVASAIGGVADYYYSEKLRTEAIDYTKDMFNQNLRTIQALPRTLSKCGAQQVNNKLFPFVELYSATDEEIQALKDKLTYNGMTINRIGKIEDYVELGAPSYIKGQIIRIEGLDGQEFHTLKEISNEINKGGFF